MITKKKMISLLLLLPFQTYHRSSVHLTFKRKRPIICHCFISFAIILLTTPLHSSVAIQNKMVIVVYFWMVLNIFQWCRNYSKRVNNQLQNNWKNLSPSRVYQVKNSSPIKSQLLSQKSNQFRISWHKLLCSWNMNM